MAGEIGPAVDDEALRIKKPGPGTGLGLVASLACQRGDDEISNADACFASTEEQDTLVAQEPSRDPQRCAQTGEGDRGRALDIVVKTADAIAVFFQEPKCVAVREVLQLDQRPRKNLLHCSNKLLDQLVIGRTSQAAVTESDIKCVSQQGFVVGADIYRHRKADSRVYSAARGVEGKFTD